MDGLAQWHSALFEAVWHNLEIQDIETPLVDELLQPLAERRFRRTIQQDVFDLLLIGNRYFPHRVTQSLVTFTEPVRFSFRNGLAHWSVNPDVRYAVGPQLTRSFNQRLVDSILSMYRDRVQQ